MTNDNCLITVSLTNWHRSNCDKTSEGHLPFFRISFYYLKITNGQFCITGTLQILNYILYATYYISLLQLYATLLLPNGIKLFETDSLLNIAIHRYINHLLFSCSTSTSWGQGLLFMLSFLKQQLRPFYKRKDLIYSRSKLDIQSKPKNKGKNASRKGS